LSSLQGRNWCFTLNNPTNEEKGLLQLNAGIDGNFRYMIFQEEIGENDTHHLQGYVEFKKSFRFNRVKRFLGTERVHIEQRRGTRDEAREYCRKQETRVAEPIEIGIWVPDCTRVDLAEFFGNVVNGASDHSLVAIDPVKFGGYGKHIERIRAVQYRQIQLDRWRRGFKPYCLCIYGKTGLGKTKFALDHYGPENVYIPPSGDGSNGSVWWPGYEGQPVIVLDDFYGGRMKPDYLLRLLDYPKGVPVQTKGGITYLIPQVIILTSNVHPEEWYMVKQTIEHPSEARYFVKTRGIPEEVYEALMRRFDLMVNIEDGIHALKENMPQLELTQY
jgi:hypothetical protein